jgi:hypothetical protein
MPRFAEKNDSDSLNLPMSDEEASDDVPQKISPSPAVTPELFLKWRSPKFGSTNPELLSNPVWDWLVRSKLSAYQANDHFDGPSPFDSGPGWCFGRFGQSSTKLSDGTIVFIGGEHEDYYDPDFYIYNDVVVQHPNGDIDIFGYPREVFPPTDSHSATLIGERIIIIGNLGYPEKRRPGFTQVYILDLRNFSISAVQTTGTSPGWIHEHEAALSERGYSIVIRRGLLERGNPGESLVENLDDWRLDLGSWKWEQLTERHWKRWEVRRKDHRRNHLWEYARVLWEKQNPEFTRAVEGIGPTSLQAALCAEPNFELFESLFRPGLPHEAVPEVEGEYNVKRIRVEGIVVRYLESGYAIQCTVEGQLPESVVQLLKQDLLEKLSVLENAPCELIEI